MKMRREEAGEAFFAQAGLQHSISGPKLCVLVQGERDIGGVVLVHITTETPCFDPASQANAVLVDKLNSLENAMQQREKLWLGKTAGIGDALLVFEDFYEDVFRANNRVFGSELNARRSW